MNLNQLLDDDCPIPTDVVFSIFEEYGNSFIKAHKFVLCCFSPVFMKMFFGALKENDNKSIEIWDTTEHAFKTMIDFFYNRSIVWKHMKVEELFNIWYIAEKYDIPFLKKDVLNKIENYHLSESNLMEVAFAAFQYQPFGISESLLSRCANYLVSSLKIKEDILKFSLDFSETEQSEIISKLMEIIDNTVVCENCKATPCRHDEKLTDVNDVVEGLKLKLTDKTSLNLFGSPYVHVIASGWVGQTLEISKYQADNYTCFLKREDGIEEALSLHGVHTIMSYNCIK